MPQLTQRNFVIAFCPTGGKPCYKASWNCFSTNPCVTATPNLPSQSTWYLQPSCWQRAHETQRSLAPAQLYDPPWNRIAFSYLQYYTNWTGNPPTKCYSIFPSPPPPPPHPKQTPTLALSSSPSIMENLTLYVRRTLLLLC